MIEKKFIIPHQHRITRSHREQLNGHKGKVLWFTGLSGSGKSTIADQVEQLLFKKKINCYILDGDNVRAGLNKDLDFSEQGRNENLRRIAEVAKLLLDAGILVLSAFVSPSKGDRDMVRNIIGHENFIEIFINTSVEECERRDVKGLYKKARAGEIKNFTGIDMPYEIPSNPKITINTEMSSVDEAAQQVIEYLFRIEEILL